jgi:hypothetical protein
MAAAPFSTALLEADEALWGGFWHFDVIAPGYLLPAVELNLLRAIRLDQSWPPETTPAQFLADLRQAILDPQAGLWRLSLAGTSCFVAATPGPPAGQELITVVWYCQPQASFRLVTGLGPISSTWTQPLNCRSRVLICHKAAEVNGRAGRRKRSKIER